jgi:putative hydrolase of the HAD superfamily
MTDVHGLAIWLVPPVTRRAEYATFIDALADRYGTPRFVPHVTLLTNVPRVEEARLRELAEACRRLDLRPRGLDIRDEFYRALIVDIEYTAELHRVRDVAERLFGSKSPDPFEPHLSLMYGDLPRATKEEARRSIEATEFPPFRAEVVEAVEIIGMPHQWPSRVQVAL